MTLMYLQVSEWTASCHSINPGNRVQQQKRIAMGTRHDGMMHAMPLLAPMSYRKEKKAERDQDGWVMGSEIYGELLHFLTELEP